MIKLIRSKENPILTPTNLLWEDMLVFNPGAIAYGNEIYLLYRAMNKNDQLSRLGLAKSIDGIHFIRSAQPLYVGNMHPFESLGIEDARVVVIGETYYLVYTAVSQMTQEKSDLVQEKNVEKIPHIALSTTKDFIHFTDYDVILPHIIGKDASLFPKKQNGKYWLLYRVEEGATYFSTSSQIDAWTDGIPLFDKRPGFWDEKKAGIGAPPIETEKGWLLFYHGVDNKNIYRLGVMVLDKYNPTTILYRSPFPIFEPTEQYEIEGYVANVVFTCGAIEKDNKYFVYYGAGDRVIGLATIEKKDILNLF